MKRLVAGLMVLAMGVLLAGCLGDGGSSAAPPNNVAAIAKDSRIVLTWDGVSGVDYWVFRAAESGVPLTPSSCSKNYSSCATTLNVVSPAQVTALFNGTAYAFTVNGRTNGGPGGVGSPTVYAMPRVAGDTWGLGTTLGSGSDNVQGVTYGATGTQFIAAGLNGLLYYGIQTTSAAGVGSITWSSLASYNPSATANVNFRSVYYDTARANFYVTGDSGTILMSPASTTTTTAWTQQTSNASGNALYAMTSNNAGFLVAVGAGGTILTSSDGSTWTAQTSGTTNNLYGVTYGYDAANVTYRFVAIGAGGTVLWSTDGATWNNVSASAGLTTDLKGITFGGLDSTNSYAFYLAVGASGKVITSLDGMTWTVQTAPTTATFNAVTYSPGRRFMAVADGGGIYYCEYSATLSSGLSWTAATSGTTSPLYGVGIGYLFDYVAVGAAGTNLYAE